MWIFYKRRFSAGLTTFDTADQEKMGKNARPSYPRAPAHICGFFFHRAAVFLLLMTLTLFGNGVEGKSMHNDDGSSPRTRSRRSVQLCGSRLVDTLNFFCKKGVYEPRNCYIATRYWCRSPLAATKLPICRISCGYTRTKRSGDIALTTQDEDYARRLHGENESDNGDNSRRIRHTGRRRIYSQCCAGKCNLADFENYCHTS